MPGPERETSTELGMNLMCLLAVALATEAVEFDPQGYVIFCPCMGRFGNQVDQLLGVMYFTRALDRTLVLPNFIDYPFPDTVCLNLSYLYCLTQLEEFFVFKVMVPFESVFEVNEMRNYLKVVTMLEFTHDIMDTLWPKDNRNRWVSYNFVQFNT
ncbi:hypothetical protein KIN20_004727 [Parelaphostrongylus tenuis]|uniref:GDP-fucose protein O-fucosyltransferase 1 n=1 Tax=Parelaphostrongylus tenuis TaxID=148309 RepID=A0AAD5M142_PARTN|nr:hypothetical protein KIN20_004727 [Parelaphostrongylus tenuis]